MLIGLGIRACFEWPFVLTLILKPSQFGKILSNSSHLPISPNPPTCLASLSFANLHKFGSLANLATFCQIRQILVPILPKSPTLPNMFGFSEVFGSFS